MKKSSLLHQDPVVDITPLADSPEIRVIDRGGTVNRSPSLTGTRLFELLLDPLLVVLTLLAVTSLFRGAIDTPHLILSSIAFLASYMVFKEMNICKAWRYGGVRAQAKDTVKGWLLVLGILASVGYLTSTSQLFSQAVIVTWALGTPWVLLAGHLGARKILFAFAETARFRRRVVIVGANKVADKLATETLADPRLNLNFLGFFDDRAAARTPGIDPSRILGALSALPDYVKRNNVDVIYIALPMAQQSRIMTLLDALRDTTASIYFMPDLFVVDLIQGRVDDVNGIPVIAVCETPFYGVNAFLKRACDLVLASGVLVMISPLLLLIGLLVKMTSRGPVLFKQRRYGLDGEEIVVYKFRSMRSCDDGDDVAQAKPNDSRVTGIGRYLRRYSLDELPQFVNVLQGRMSIVGPRPHAVAHNEMYRKLIKGYMVRHKVKPGITGWAQVNGLRGETETVDKMEARIDYDLDYLRNWSLWLDMKIIGKTILLTLGDKNAY